MDKVASDYTLCPKFNKAFSILGKKWNGLIIDVLLVEGDQRFVELSKKIPLVSDRVLVERLKELEKERIIHKENNLYCLTPRGIALQESMHSVKKWAENWVSKEECS